MKVKSHGFLFCKNNSGHLGSHSMETQLFFQWVHFQCGIYIGNVSGKYTEITLTTSEAVMFCAFTAPFPSALKYSLFGAT